MESQIDIVITWVDGQDERLNALRRQYASSSELVHDDIGGVTRYASIGEISWCVASINRFAPWVHRIYVVTDGQDPHLTPFLETQFPDGYIPVEIVDHRQIFAGYESFLPTFNSLSLETMLWRIPGLSEQFIEMNDDLMFCSPVQPEDFFTPEGYPVCYSTKNNILLTSFTRLFIFRKDGSRRLTFKGNMMAAAKIIGNKWTYLKLYHTMKPLCRSAFEECYANRPDLIERNIRHRFRHSEHYNAEELHYLYLLRKHQLEVKSPQGLLFYLEPKGKEGYVQKKLALLESGNYKFCCFNNLNKATEDELKEVKAYIAKTLSIEI